MIIDYLDVKELAIELESLENELGDLKERP
jgi:hypothetical protein